MWLDLYVYIHWCVYQLYLLWAWTSCVYNAEASQWSYSLTVCTCCSHSMCSAVALRTYLYIGVQLYISMICLNRSSNINWLVSRWTASCYWLGRAIVHWLRHLERQIEPTLPYYKQASEIDTHSEQQTCNVRWQSWKWCKVKDCLVWHIPAML